MIMQESVVVKVTAASSDRETGMTSGTSSQSDSSEPPAYSADTNNNTNTMSPTGGGATGIELIVSKDSDSDRSNTGGPPRQDSQHAGSRRGSLPDVMRLLPPIRDHDSDSVVQQGSAAGTGSVGLRFTRSNSPLLVLDRGGGPGLCFRASESEKMLPMLLNTDAGLHRSSHGLLSYGSHDGSSSSGPGRPLSPRPPSPSLPHHISKDKPIKPAALPHHLQRRIGEDKQLLSMDTGPPRRLKPDGPLNDITDIHPTMLRRRSCQSPNRLMLSERRRASEGLLAAPPSHLGQYPKTKTKLEPQAQQTKLLPSRGLKEVGELITTAPARKPKGHTKTSRNLDFTRMSRLNSASLEAVNRHDDDGNDSQERRRILRWLEGVKRGSDSGSTDNTELGVRQLRPLSRSSPETAIRHSIPGSDVDNITSSLAGRESLPPYTCISPSFLDTVKPTTMSGLKAPRRKRRIYQPLDSPFPIPIESITRKPASCSRWFYYTARLQDNCVLVQQQGDLIFLYKMGFFGKGLLSKSKPEHNIFLNSYQGLRKRNLPPKERRFQQQRFQQVRKNRYERHLSWSKQFIRQSQNLAEGDAKDTSASIDGPSDSEEISEVEICQQESSKIQRWSPPAKMAAEKDDECTMSDDVIAGTDDVTPQTGDIIREDIPVDFSSSKSSDEMARTDDATTRTDDATTRTDDVTTRIDDVITRTDDVTTRTDDATTRTDDVTTRTGDVTTRTDDVTTRTDDVTTRTDDVTTRTDDVTTRTDDVTTRTDDVTTRTDDDTTRTDVTTRTDDVTIRTDDVTARTDDVIMTHVDVTVVKEVTKTLEMSALKSTEDRNKDESSAKETVAYLDSDNKQLQSEVLVGMETAEAGCQETQVSSSTLPETEGVGTQEEMEDQGHIRKEDPYQIHECLHLKLEEAFFLSYGLGCLSVVDETKRVLDLTEMWQTFCSRQRNFVASYVAYHYYRSKGWVPRDGLKYGAHYVLYKHGPPFYHGSYSVIVQMVTDGSWDSSDTSTTMTWPALSGMDRITETVAKEVMFCYVIRPSDLSDLDMQSPKCIPRFRVQEIVMKRWVSSRERDLKDQQPPLIS